MKAEAEWAYKAWNVLLHSIYNERSSASIFNSTHKTYKFLATLWYITLLGNSSDTFESWKPENSCNASYWTVNKVSQETTNNRSRLSQLLEKCLFWIIWEILRWNIRGGNVFNVGKIVGHLGKLCSECFVEIFNSFQNSFSADNNRV